MKRQHMPPCTRCAGRGRVFLVIGEPLISRQCIRCHGTGLSTERKAAS